MTLHRKHHEPHSVATRAFKSALLAATLTFGGIVTAQAAGDIFIKIPGIPGESVVKNHVGEIDAIGFSSNATIAGAPGGGGAGKVAVCGQVTFTKLIDKASPLLLGALFRGIHIPTASLVFERPGASTFDFYKIDLMDFIVTSVTQTDPQASNVVTETVVLQAEKFAYTYTPQTAKGTPGTPVTFGFDCKNYKPT